MQRIRELTLPARLHCWKATNFMIVEGASPDAPLDDLAMVRQALPVPAPRSTLVASCTPRSDARD